MTTNTRKRYNSSFEHLKRLKGSVADHDAFRTNLDDFVVSARSVTLIMQKEFAHIPGFHPWYIEKQKMMDADPIFKFFKIKRNISQKEKPIDTTLSVTLSKSCSYVVAGQSSIPEPTSPDLQTPTRYTRSFEDKPEGYSEKEVITLCEKYIAKLESIVDECERRFVGNVET